MLHLVRHVGHKEVYMNFVVAMTEWKETKEKLIYSFCRLLQLMLSMWEGTKKNLWGEGDTKKEMYRNKNRQMRINRIGYQQGNVFRLK